MASNKNNTKRFFRQLDREFEAKVSEPVLDRRNRIMLFLLEGVIEKSPVLFGQLRGNWIVTRGPPSENVNEDAEDISGRESQTAGQNAILQAPLGDMSLANNVQHAMVVEEGGFIPKDPGPSKSKIKGRKGRILVKGGFSVQAPQGMLRLTIQEAKQIFSLK